VRKFEIWVSIGPVFRFNARFDDIERASLEIEWYENHGMVAVIIESDGSAPPLTMEGYTLLMERQVSIDE